MATSTVTRIERPVTSDLVAEHLRRQIFDGHLRPGQRIAIDAIAAELGVSRLPVREAVQAMARDGLVDTRTHHGAYVGDFDAQSIRDHFEIVGLTHGLAAARLAETPDPELIDRLAGLVDEIAATSDPEAVNAATVLFYREINARGGSSRLRAVLRTLGRLLPSGFFAEVDGSVATARDGSAKLLAAIRSGDAELARTVALESQRRRSELIVGHLVERGVIAAASSPTNGGQDG